MASGPRGRGGLGSPPHSPRECVIGLREPRRSSFTFRGGTRGPLAGPTGSGRPRLLALLPADSRAADLLVGQAGVEGDLGGERLRAPRSRSRSPSRGRGGRRARQATASRGGCRRGGGRSGRTRWTRPSGWVTVPSFSAWDSAGRKTSAWPPDAFPNIPTSSTKSAAPRAVFQRSGSGSSRIGSTSQRITASSSSGLQRVADLRSRSCPLPSRRGRGRPSGRQPTSRRPRALVVSGTSIMPAPSAERLRRLGARGERGERPLAVGAVPDPLAEDDDRVARVESAGDPLAVFAAGAARGARELRGEVREHRRGFAGRVAKRLLGSAVERGRALGDDRDAGAVIPHRLAQAQVEDRHRVEGVGADDQDRLRRVDVAPSMRRARGGRAQARSRARGPGRRASRRAASRAPGARFAGAGSPPRSRPGFRSGSPSGVQPPSGRRRLSGALRPMTPCGGRRRCGPSGRGSGPRSGTSESRSGPCRRASHRRPRGCRAPGRGRRARRGR